MVEKFIERKLKRISAKTDFINRKWIDIPYADFKKEDLKLDIYLPNKQGETYPVILDVYGGGLYFGSKSSHKLEPALRLLEQGYAVVSIDYSLIWQADFPTQIYEVKEAIRWLHQNGGRYHLDVNRIALMGESSGAHLAMLTAATIGTSTFDERQLGETLTTSEQISAVIALYGPYEFDQFEVQFLESGVEAKYSETGTAESFEGQMFGKKAPKEVPNLVEAYNPATYLSMALPPVLLFVGKEDAVVPYQQSVNLFHKIQDVVPEDRAELVILDHAGHGPSAYMTPELTAVKKKFLQQWL